MDDPVYCSVKTGKNGYIQHTWKVNGELHKEDGPAKFLTTKNGRVISEEWYIHGKRHRDHDLPAFIQYYNTNEVVEQSWYKNGVRTRDNNQPAFIRYYRNGHIMEQMMYKDGNKHCDHHPQRSKFDIDGKAYQQSWYKDGLQHREDGPSAILVNRQTGEVEEIWTNNGKSITKEVKEWIEEMNLPNWTEWGDDALMLFKLTFIGG